MKRLACAAIVIGLILLFPVSPTSWGQAGQAGVWVIEGGTLIDGNGGPPVADAVIVIRGNRIESVSKKGQGAYPAGAQVVKADGKFIVPGLMDAHTHYDEHLLELFLNNGVTSIFEIGGGEEYGMVQKKAIAQGKFSGPRLFIAVGSMAGGRISELAGITAAASPYSMRQVVMTPEKAREVSKRFIDAGADVIKVHRGPPIEVYQAAAEEAHKAGLAMLAQPLGPTVYAREAVMAGADILEHAAGVGYSVAKDPSKWKGWGQLEEHSLDPSIWADMDDAKAADMIQLLVQKHVYVEPDLICQGRGIEKRRDEYELADYRLLDLPALAYIPERTRLKWLDNYTEFDDAGPGVRELRIKGFENMKKFVGQFVRAGGKILSGTDASGNGWAVAGIGLHHELDILVSEVGLTPMQAIVASTHNVAEAYRMSDRLGTIEKGKLADLLIVNDDPLKDIRNLQKIDQIVKDGKIVDRTYHGSYANPLPNMAVEGATWVAALKKETESMRTTSFGQLSPGIESVSPNIVTEGGPAFTLSIKGVGFTKRSRVFVGDETVPATLVSGTEIKASIDAAHLARPGTYPIVVTNPEPLQRPNWGGTSNRAFLLVDYKY